MPADTFPHPEPATMDLPINLGLNDGTYCPEACLDVLKRHYTRTSLRNYTTPDNDPLREALAEKDGVTPDHIYLTNGSGPILQQCMPWIIRHHIQRSPAKIAKHLLTKNGFPIITPKHTYSKVPLKAAKRGLTVKWIPIGPEDDFALPLDTLDTTLARGDGMVYLANPNNPTGHVQITREQLVPRLERFRRSLFWIDEAYVQYCEPEHHQPLSDLVNDHPNMVVSRTFSFAYGLAGVRIGYLIARPDWVEVYNSQVTNYRLGTLQEQLGIAAVQDDEHLPFVRARCREARELLVPLFDSFEGVQAWDSTTNFFLCRFTDGRTGAWLKEQLLARGIKIKIFTNGLGQTYDEYFRITLGVEQENQFLAEQVKQILG